MIYGSVCSGIEAATVAWKPLGWSPAFFSEIDPFPCHVLAHHYGSNLPGEKPSSNGVPNYGDMTKFKEWPDHAIDILVGGTPCQSFSVAGLRKGLDDPRGNLMLTYLAIARRYQPKWLVWENVPGVLSSNKGRDFAAFIQGLEECGYHAAWRVLDAQYVRVDGYGRAVPQRRRRVFVVGYLGDWRRAAAVLFEREGLRGDPAPRRKAGKSIAPDASSSLRAQGNASLRADSDAYVGSFGIPGNWIGRKPENGGNSVEPMIDVSPCLTNTDRHGVAAARMVAFGEYVEDGTASFLKARDYKDATDLVTCIHGTQDPCTSEDTAFALGRNSGQENAIMNDAFAVRRLTPTECERLQGFPDDYTNISTGKRMAADSPRYKALGNSMAINCMRWIGRRIEMVEVMHVKDIAA